MRILLVSTGSGSRGGGETYLLVLAKALSRLGHDLHMVVPDHPRMDELRQRAAQVGKVHAWSATNTYDRPLRSVGAAFDLQAAGRFRRFVAGLAPDVVHLNQQVLEDGLELLRGATGSGIPLVITTHITHSASELNAFGGRLRDWTSERLVGRLAAPLITVGQVARSVLERRLARFRGAADRISVVYNGVEAPAPLDEADRRELRRGWSVEAHVPVIGVVGRLEAQKNPHFLLDVLAPMRRSGSVFKLVWVGDGALRSEFEARAEALGLADVVQVDGWRDDVPARLQAMDIFALPSKFEGLPFALQEAMMAGLPACVSAVDGMREAVEDKATGVLCGANDSDAWRAGLSSLLGDASLRTRMGKAAAARAHSMFGLRSMGERTEAAYRRAMRVGSEG